MRDYRIGIAVALLLAVGLVVYFAINNNSDETSDNNNEQEKPAAKKDGRNRIAKTGDSNKKPIGGELVKLSTTDPLPVVEDPAKTTESAKSKNILEKPKVIFSRPLDNKPKTYGRKPGVLILDDGSESDYRKPSLSLAPYKKTTDPGKTPLKPLYSLGTSNTGKATFHTVVKGENFSVIAKKKYGNPKYWTLISEANPDVDSRNLRPGDVLKIPPLPRTTLVASKKTGIKHGTVTRKIGGGSSYVVKDGDSYWKIAKEQYGNGSLYQVIQDANKDIPPRSLKPGQSITIPPRPVKKTATVRRSTPRTTERTTRRPPVTPPEPADIELVTNDKGEVFD